MHFPLFVVFLRLFLFCYALLCIHSSFAIILMGKRKLDALLLLSYRYILTIYVLWFFLTVPWVGLQCVIVVKGVELLNSRRAPIEYSDQAVWTDLSLRCAYMPTCNFAGQHPLLESATVADRFGFILRHAVKILLLFCTKP